MNFVAASKWIHEHDPTRPVHYERAEQQAARRHRQPHVPARRGHGPRGGERRPPPAHPVRVLARDGQQQRRLRRVLEGLRGGHARPRRRDLGLGRPGPPRRRCPPRVVVKDRTKHGLEALFVGRPSPGRGRRATSACPTPTTWTCSDALTLEAVLYPRPALMGAAYPHVARFHPFVSKGDLGFQLMQDGDAAPALAALPGRGRAAARARDGPGRLVRRLAPADRHLRRPGGAALRRRQARRLGREGGPPLARATSRSTSAATPSASTCGRPARFREARVYSRALAEAEVAAPESRRDDGLVLWLDVADAKQAKPGGDGFYFAYGGDFGPTHDAVGRELLPERRRLRRPHAPPRRWARSRSSSSTWTSTAVDLAKGVRLGRRTGTTSRRSRRSRPAASRSAADDRVAGGGRPARPRRRARTPRSRSRVPLPAITPEPGVEYWLDVTFALKADTPWAKAGHVLARRAAAAAAREAGRRRSPRPRCPS